MVFIKKESKKYSLIIVGIFLILISSGLIVFKYYSNKKQNQINTEMINDFFINQTNYPTKEIAVENQKNDQTKDYSYIAILEIPTISLKRGLVDENSYYNNVDYNIQILGHSSMPDVVNGNLILASHNGRSNVSFFKNLYKLKKNDKVYVYYNGFKYEYTINTNYDIPKDGKIEINRDYEKSTITLITCKNNTNDTQIVYIGYLTNKEKY